MVIRLMFCVFLLVVNTLDYSTSIGKPVIHFHDAPEFPGQYFPEIPLSQLKVLKMFMSDTEYFYSAHECADFKQFLSVKCCMTFCAAG